MSINKTDYIIVDLRTVPSSTTHHEKIVYEQQMIKNRNIDLI